MCVQCNVMPVPREAKVQRVDKRLQGAARGCRGLQGAAAGRALTRGATSQRCSSRAPGGVAVRSSRPSSEWSSPCFNVKGLSTWRSHRAAAPSLSRAAPSAMDRYSDGSPSSGSRPHRPSARHAAPTHRCSPAGRPSSRGTASGASAATRGAASASAAAAALPPPPVAPVAPGVPVPTARGAVSAASAASAEKSEASSVSARTATHAPGGFVRSR